MNTTALRRALALLALALSASSGVAQQSVPDAAKAQDMRRAIMAWMDCVECTHAELASVLRFDSMAVPSLAAVLRNGPSPTLLAVKRKQYAEDHDRLASYLEEKGQRTRMSRGEFVAEAIGRYSARHRMRAAIALTEIGTEQALGEVRQAIAASTDERFKQRLSKALERAEARRRVTPTPGAR